MAIKPKLLEMEEKMKKTTEVSDTIDFECPECGGTLVEDSKTVTHCTMCNQVFKSRDLIAVDTVYVMEDEDLIDDSGIGHELRELLNNM